VRHEHNIHTSPSPDTYTLIDKRRQECQCGFCLLDAEIQKRTDAATVDEIETTSDKIDQLKQASFAVFYVSKDQQKGWRTIFQEYFSRISDKS
jgi:hypothetical protein